MADKIVVSYSELDTFRQCPLKWKWSYQERWRQPETGGARGTGTLFHAALEEHYRVLRDYQERNGTPSPVRGAIAEAGLLGRARQAVEDLVLIGIENESTRDLIEWMYLGYVEQYGCDPDWRILEIESKDEIQLGTIWVPVEDPVRDYPDQREVEVWVKTRIDLVVEDLDIGGNYIVDHKSGKNLSSDLELDLDAQFDLYTWAKRRQGMQIAGAIRNEARTTRNQGDYPENIRAWEEKKAAGKTKAKRPEPQELTARHQRVPLDRTDVELDWQAQDTLNLVQAMYSGAPIYSSPNPDQCKWKCDHKDVHLMVRKGLDPDEMHEDFGFVQDFRRN